MEKEKYIVELAFTDGSKIIQLWSKEDCIQELSRDARTTRFFKLPPIEDLTEVSMEVVVKDLSANTSI